MTSTAAIARRCAKTVHHAPTYRWACYADSFDERIRIVSDTEDEARRVAAEHFKCPADYVICRYVSTICDGTVVDG